MRPEYGLLYVCYVMIGCLMAAIAWVPWCLGAWLAIHAAAGFATLATHIIVKLVKE